MSAAISGGAGVPKNHAMLARKSEEDLGIKLAPLEGGKWRKVEIMRSMGRDIFDRIPDPNPPPPATTRLARAAARISSRKRKEKKIRQMAGLLEKVVQGAGPLVTLRDTHQKREGSHANIFNYDLVNRVVNESSSGSDPKKGNRSPSSSPSPSPSKSQRKPSVSPHNKKASKGKLSAKSKSAPKPQLYVKTPQDHQAVLEKRLTQMKRLGTPGYAGSTMTGRATTENANVNIVENLTRIAGGLRESLDENLKIGTTKDDKDHETAKIAIQQHHAALCDFLRLLKDQNNERGVRQNFATQLVGMKEVDRDQVLSLLLELVDLHLFLSNHDDALQSKHKELYSLLIQPPQDKNKDAAKDDGEDSGLPSTTSLSLEGDEASTGGSEEDTTSKGEDSEKDGPPSA